MLKNQKQIISEQEQLGILDNESSKGFHQIISPPPLPPPHHHQQLHNPSREAIPLVKLKNWDYMYSLIYLLLHFVLSWDNSWTKICLWRLMTSILQHKMNTLSTSKRLAGWCQRNVRQRWRTGPWSELLHTDACRNYCHWTSVWGDNTVVI